MTRKRWEKRISKYPFACYWCRQDIKAGSWRWWDNFTLGTNRKPISGCEPCALGIQKEAPDSEAINSAPAAPINSPVPGQAQVERIDLSAYLTKTEIETLLQSMLDIRSRELGHQFKDELTAMRSSIMEELKFKLKALDVLSGKFTPST
jgi:hypothetical protein